MSSLQQALQIALEHHQQGRLGEAEAGYRRILEAQPNHAGALHYLGMVAGQTGAYDKAIELIGRAIEADGRPAEFHCNLAEAYRATGRLEEAAGAYRRALEINPGLANAHFALAELLREGDRLEEAKESLGRGLALAPDTPIAYCMLGDIARRRGDARSALDHYQRATGLAPDMVLAHNNLGSLLQKVGHLDEAVAAYRRAIGIDPGQARMHVNLGHAMKELGRLDEAVACYRTALRLDQGCAEAHFGLANARREAGEAEAAITGYERAIELDPDFTEAHSAYGVLLTELGRPAEAVDRFQRVLALAPRHVRSYANLGLALAAQGLWEDVEAFFDYDRLVRRRRFDAVPGWDSLDRFNAAVADYIHGRPDLMRDRPSVATKGGSQTENILLDDHPVTRRLESMVREFYRDYLAATPADGADPYFDRPPASWFVKANAVVLTSNGYQDPHIHPVGFCSGVYYVRIPETVKAAVDSEAGYIRFGKAAPGAVPDRTRYVSVKPEEGLMVMFPSYFWHGTIPFESDQDRICVAFDIEPC